MACHPCPDAAGKISFRHEKGAACLGCPFCMVRCIHDGLVLLLAWQYQFRRATFIAAPLAALFR